MQKIRSVVLSFAVLIGLVAPIASSVSVYADTATTCSSPADCISKGPDSIKSGDTDKSLQDYIKIIVNVLLFILGAIAVIMIIIGGIRYTTSNGDASATKSAKDTILYAVIGLIVAILAFAIVNFVIGTFGGK